MKTMINWFSIPCTDFNRAVAFYENIFGISMLQDKDPMGNELAFFFPPTEGIAGAINADKNLKPSDAGTRIYLNAEGKLDAILGRIEKAGGKVIMPKTAIPQWGNIGIIRDSEGNLVGLHSAK